MFRTASLFLVLILASVCAFSQEPYTKTLTGVVSDATGSPLAGVDVRLTALQGIRHATTDASGHYLFSDAPAIGSSVFVTRDGKIPQKQTLSTKSTKNGVLVIDIAMQ